MKVASVSLIVTVYNEQSTIIDFLKSALNQTFLPEEIIVVDGGSKDNTVKLISSLIPLAKAKNVQIKFLIKKGNRSTGRNRAVKASRNEIILCSDSGNILDKKWIENIIKPFNNKSVNVVAGYYKGLSRGVFQESLIPYVLVMEDNVDEKNFLPATRSMAFKKSIWKKAGGFEEKLSHNEDYAFANKLKQT